MISDHPARQRGATLVHWLIAMIVMLAVGIFAVDLNDLFVAHTELQKAADAGALEGARQLYTASGTTVNTAVGQCTGLAL